MYRIITFPPLYFFSAIALCLMAYLLFPAFNVIALPFRLLGPVLIVGGGYLLNTSSGIFDAHETTFYLETPSAFVTSGTYRYSRNPMYLGAVVLISGLALLLGNMLSLLVAVLFFFAINSICIPPEEKLMTKTFGDEYLAYKKKVRRWL